MARAAHGWARVPHQAEPGGQCLPRRDKGLQLGVDSPPGAALAAAAAVAVAAASAAVSAALHAAAEPATAAAAAASRAAAQLSSASTAETAAVDSAEPASEPLPRGAASASTRRQLWGVRAPAQGGSAAAVAPRGLL